MIFWSFIPVFLVMVSSGSSQANSLDENVLDQMTAADIVILGETHDNAEHHRGQADLISRIRPRAIVFEMLTPDMAKIVNAGVPPGPELAEALSWEMSGWPDFEMYAPVFEALPPAVAVGAALPSGDVRAAFQSGAKTVFRGDAVLFGLDSALPDAEQAAREALQFTAHCEAMPLQMMGGMVEAQRLRDAHFASVAMQAAETHGAPVIVITGSGHARTDWGMPRFLARAAPERSVFSMAFVETSTGDVPFDAVVVTAPAPREDPCLMFKK